MTFARLFEAATGALRTPDREKAAAPVITSAPKWTFDAETAASWTDIVSRSIPQHDDMRELTAALASRFSQDDTWIVDLGCSLGESLDGIIRRRGPRNRYMGIDNSVPMLDAARKRLAVEIDAGLVDLRTLDLRSEYPRVKNSVTLSVLTLQFIPTEYRQAIIQRVYNELLPGGAFLLVEKILGSGEKIDSAMVSRYISHHLENGYSEEELRQRRRALEGISVPITGDWNEVLLRSAGFREIDTFWRWLNFSGWIAVK